MIGRTIHGVSVMSTTGGTSTSLRRNNNKLKHAYREWGHNDKITGRQSFHWSRRRYQKACLVGVLADRYLPNFSYCIRCNETRLTLKRFTISTIFCGSFAFHRNTCAIGIPPAVEYSSTLNVAIDSRQKMYFSESSLSPVWEMERYRSCLNRFTSISFVEQVHRKNELPLEIMSGRRGMITEPTLSHQRRVYYTLALSLKNEQGLSTRNRIEVYVTTIDEPRVRIRNAMNSTRR